MPQDQLYLIRVRGFIHDCMLREFQLPFPCFFRKTPGIRVFHYHIFEVAVSKVQRRIPGQRRNRVLSRGIFVKCFLKRSFTLSKVPAEINQHSAAGGRRQNADDCQYKKRDFHSGAGAPVSVFLFTHVFPFPMQSALPLTRDGIPCPRPE